MAEFHVQGSAGWRADRLGKITASRFQDPVTQPKTKAAKAAGELSQTAQSYLLKLAAEILTGQDQDPAPTWQMEWGTANEPGARMVYETLMCPLDIKVQEVGFIEHPLDPMIGGSPDGLVGEDGGIEIKCPGNTYNHLAYILGGVLPKEHVAQVQGLLWITGRKWWDFVSYDPRIKDVRLALWVLRVERDEPYISTLERLVSSFKDKLLETLCKLKGDQS